MALLTILVSQSNLALPLGQMSENTVSQENLQQRRAHVLHTLFTSYFPSYAPAEFSYHHGESFDKKGTTASAAWVAYANPYGEPLLFDPSNIPDEGISLNHILQGNVHGSEKQRVEDKLRHIMLSANVVNQ